MQQTRFDRIVWAIALSLLAVIAIVIWRGDQVGVVITRTVPDDGGFGGAGGPILIEFGQRMDIASVESHFAIEPSVAGSFVWRGNVFYFMPSQSFDPGAHYQVSLRAGIETELGHISKENVELDFEVREPGIAYLIQDEQGYELWTMPDLKNAPVLVSDPAYSVFDYVVAPNGEQLLYSLVNTVGGIDLWVASRAGGDAQELLDCGTDRCYAPDWSATGQIAYSRSPAPFSPGEAYGAPRIWLLDPATGETLRLHADTQKIGYGPSWSPNAQRLAYYDGVVGRIIVLDMQNGNETYLPSRAGIVGTWTPDGGQMLYYDTQSIEGKVVNLIFRADFETQDILSFFDPQPTDGDYSYPIVSPNGEWVAVRVKPNSSTNEQIWIMPADGRFGFVVTDEPEFLYSNISWNPESDELLFYRIRLGTADREPQVWQWRRETGELKLLVEGASLPAWLP